MGTDPNLKLTEMGGFVIVTVSGLLVAGFLNILEGPCRLYSIIAQTDAGVIDFLKLWDDINPVVGTTDPDYSFKVESDVWNSIAIDPDGIVFDNGLSMAADDAGGTASGTVAVAFNVVLVLRRGAS